LLSLVKECHKNKITVKAMISDMMSDNQALCSELGIYANERGDNCLVPSPVEDDKYIVLMDDTNHAFKNFKRALLSYQVN
jgi:hypothetical protein